MMSCQALSVLLVVISTLKIVIGQSHGYYLASFLRLPLICGFRKLVFSRLDRSWSSYCVIHCWLYQLTVMVSTNYVCPKLLVVHTVDLAISDQLWVS